MKTFWKVALGILVTLVGLVGLVLLWAFLSYPAEYVMRGIRWGDADVYDYKKFPARPVAANPSPFLFEEEPAEAVVQELFEQAPEPVVAEEAPTEAAAAAEEAPAAAEPAAAAEPEKPAEG